MHFEPTALHWMMAGMFVFAGILMFTRGRNYAGPQTASHHLRIASPDVDAASERIEAAIARRQIAEGQPARLGLWLGGLSFVLAAAAATGRVP